MKLPSKAAFLRAINKTQAFIKEKPYVLMLAFVVVGVLTLIFTSAASTTVSLQPEDAACAGLKQTTASGYSGSGYVRFAANPCPSSTGSDFYPYDCSAIAAGGYCYRRLGLGAGGFMSGMDIARDGTVVVRSDVIGPYVLEKDSSGKDIWMSLISYGALPDSDQNTENILGSKFLSGRSGSWEVAVYDKNLIYIGNRNAIYKANRNSSGHWKLTDISTGTAIAGNKIDYNSNGVGGPNLDGGSSGGQGRLIGEYMVVSDDNPAIVYAVAKDGVYGTNNAGASWNRVMPFSPACTTDMPCGSVVINEAEDRVYFMALSTLAGASKQIWVASANGTSAFSNTGMLSTNEIVHAVYDGTGAIFYTEYDANNSGRIAKIINGSRTFINNPFGTSGRGDAIHSIAVKDNGMTIAANGAGVGSYALSRDGGVNWTVTRNATAVGRTDIPWFSFKSPYVSAPGGEYEQDTGVISEIGFSGTRLWQAQGIGMNYKETNPDTPLDQWFGLSRNIENMVNSAVLSYVDPSGKSHVFTAHHDRGAFERTWTADPSELTTGPAVKPWMPFVNSYNVLRDVTGAGYSPNGRYMAAIQHRGGNDGTLWCADNVSGTLKYAQNVNMLLSIQGAGISVNDSGKIFVNIWKTASNGGQVVQADCSQSTLTLTTKTLTQVGMTGFTPSDSFDSAYWTGSDKQTSGIDASNNMFAAQYSTNNSLAIFKSSTGGDSWSKVTEVSVSGIGFWHQRLKVVPGRTDEVFLASGDTDTSNTVCGPASYFKRSGSSTFDTIPNISEVVDFGFGKPATAGAFPPVYMIGCVSGVLGAYVSNNFNPTNLAAATWTRLDTGSGLRSRFNTVEGFIAIDGDKKRSDCFYLLTSNNGGYYACKQ